MWLARSGCRRVATVALCLSVAGCGLSIDERTIAIADGDLPTELNEPTTTTTTTAPPTTTVTTASATTPPSAPPTTTPATTGPDPVQIGVDVYYPLAGTDDEMYLFHTTIDGPGGIDRLIDVLTEPDDEARRDGLRTAIASGFILSHELDRGVLRVDLDAGQYNRMADYKKRQAVAQMVLSFSSYAPPGQGGIAQVAFSVGGEPESVGIPNQGASARGEGVYFDDFASLIRQLDTATTTTAVRTPTRDTEGSVSASSAPSTSIGTLAE